MCLDDALRNAQVEEGAEVGGQAWLSGIDGVCSSQRHLRLQDKDMSSPPGGTVGIWEDRESEKHAKV